MLAALLQQRIHLVQLGRNFPGNAVVQAALFIGLQAAFLQVNFGLHQVVALTEGVVGFPQMLR